jgi:hypothetical protein
VHTLRSASWIVLACAVAAGTAGCGNSSTSTSGSLPTAPAATSAATGGSQAATEQQIAGNWTTFFDPKTPVSKRVALLEDGQTFASIIQAQAGSTLESEASAQVTQVALTSSTQARVNYSILLAGQPALPNQHGDAVLQDGVWKVGISSFCALLTLEQGGSTKGLPAACATASG